MRILLLSLLISGCAQAHAMPHMFPGCKWRIPVGSADSWKGVCVTERTYREHYKHSDWAGFSTLEGIERYDK